MNYRKYKIRTCLSSHHCNLCTYPIKLGERYYDGGYDRRAHVLCNDGVETPANKNGYAKTSFNDQKNEQ